jgi:superfamily II DNA or RNA helicase
MKMSPRNDLVPLRPGYEPREWQVSAARALAYHARLGTRRMVISAATGVGKGDLLAAFIAKAVWQGKRVGFAVHRDFLLQDVYNRAMAIEPAMYAGRVQGRTNQPDTHATFMSLQTVSDKERAKSIGALSWLFVDEAHYFMCPSGFAVLEALEEANPGLRVVGCTATPFRSAGAGKVSGLGAMFGTEVGGLDSPISEYSIADGIADGVLSPMHAKRYVPLYERAKHSEDKVADILDTDDHNEAVVKAYLERRAPGIAFCASVGHAVHLAEMFKKHGVRAEAVWDHSNTIDKNTKAKFGKDKDRERKIAAAQAGEVEVLTNLDLLSTGFDWRPCTNVMLVRPTGSAGLLAQMVGRGTRLSPETGKIGGLVMDFVDNLVTHDLGLPADLSTPAARIRSFDPGDVVRHRRDPRLTEGIVTEVDDDRYNVRWRGADRAWHHVDELSIVRKRSEREEIRIAPRVIGLQEYPVTLIRGDVSAHWYAHSATATKKVRGQPVTTKYKLWTIKAMVNDTDMRVQVRSSGPLFDAWFVPPKGAPVLERSGFEKSDDAMEWAVARVRELGGRIAKPDEAWKHERCTPQQGGYLRHLGHRSDTENMSRGQAAALIASLSANQEILDALDPKRIAARAWQKKARRAG